jgi:glycine oxidase
MLLLRSRDVHFSRPVRFLHPRIPLYVVPREDGLLMLGATSIESDYDGPVSMRSAMELLHAAYALHPALAEADVVEFGVGVRPAFPDNVPRLLSKDRVVHFNGLYRHGFLLSPWYAEQLAAQIVESMAEAA